MSHLKCLVPLHSLPKRIPPVIRDTGRSQRLALDRLQIRRRRMSTRRGQSSSFERHIHPNISRAFTNLPRTPYGLSRPLVRAFTSSTTHLHGDLTPPKPGHERHVTFLDKEGASHTFEVADGDNLLDIAQANDLEMEGACGGSCACSTCHVIVQDEEMYDKMEEPSDDENDMLDLAFGLTETSRLGCQVKMSKDLDGLVVKLPSMTRNMQASDFAEKEKKS